MNIHFINTIEIEFLILKLLTYLHMLNSRNAIPTMDNARGQHYIAIDILASYPSHSDFYSGAPMNGEL
jgi:hypothetical protein